MAEVTKLANGRYKVRWRDASGQRHSPGYSFPTKQAAKRYGDDRDAEVRRGEGRDPRAGRQTLASWLDDWWEGRVGEDRTLAANKQTLKKYVLEAVGDGRPLGDLRLEQLDEVVIQSWIGRMERLVDADDEPLLAPASILRHFRTLSAVLRPAIRTRRIPFDPLTNIVLPTVPPGRDFFWERDEIELLRSVITDVRDRALFEVLVGTGARWGEVAGLHLDRWHPLKKRMTVARTVVERDGYRLKEYPKGKTRRDLPLPDYVIEAVAAHLATTPARDCGLSHGRGKTCPGLIFWHAPERGSAFGVTRPLSRAQWPAHEFKDYVTAAGVREGRLHDLRHTYASLRVMDGVDLRILQELLGHASITTTERYAHLAPNALDHPALAASLAASAPQIRGADGGQTAIAAVD